MLAQGSGNDQHNGIVGLFINQFFNLEEQGFLESAQFEKNLIRQAMKKRLAAMTPEEYNSSNLLIRKKFIQLDIVRAANKIMLYYAVNNEVETVLLIEELLQLGKTIALPVCMEEKTLRAGIIYNLDELVQGPYGLYEPGSKAKTINPTDLDLIVVPGLAFDQKGYRIGHGAGYYDRFLTGVNAYTLGLAYYFQVVPQLPTELHDILLNGILTSLNFWNIQDKKPAK